jgi:hypothetical protein
MTARPFLLDTSVLLHLIRGRDLGRYINVTFDLSNVVHRPLVSIVTHARFGFWPTGMAGERKNETR